MLAPRHYRPPESPPNTGSWRQTIQSQVLRPVWQWEMPKELGREGPFSEVLGLCSLPLLCRILGGNRGLLV